MKSYACGGLGRTFPYPSDIVDHRLSVSREAHDDILPIHESLAVDDAKQLAKPRIFAQMVPSERKQPIQYVDRAVAVSSMIEGPLLRGVLAWRKGRTEYSMRNIR